MKIILTKKEDSKKYSITTGRAGDIFAIQFGSDYEEKFNEFKTKKEPVNTYAGMLEIIK
jgi:hypothetical protein